MTLTVERELSVSGGKIRRLPLLAGAALPVRGSLLSWHSSGYAHGLVAGEAFAGVCDQTARGGGFVDAITGLFDMLSLSAIAGVAIADVAAATAIYASSDATLTATALGNTRIGSVAGIDGVRVRIAAVTKEIAASVADGVGLSQAQVDARVALGVAVAEAYTDAQIALIPAASGGGLFGSQTLVVSEAGDDTAAALDPYGAEFLTIEAAMAAAAAGDLVVVRPGTYSPNPGAGHVTKTGVNCLCFPGVTIHLLSGSWAGDGGGAGELVHDLLGYPTMNLDAGALIFKRTGSGTAKGRYEIREIIGSGAGFFNTGGAVDLDIDIAYDSAVYADIATMVVDGGLGWGAGLVLDDGTADSNIVIRFRDATLTEAVGSEAGARLFAIVRATSRFYAKGRRTQGSIELRCISDLDIDYIGGGTSINAVLSTLRLAGGACFLSCNEIRQAAGNRGCINVSHNAAVLHFLRGRAIGVSGGAEIGHAIIYTDASVGINLYNGVVLIADAGDAASRSLIANPAVAPLAINAKVMGAIVANKAKDAGVTLTVGSITADTDVA